MIIVSVIIYLLVGLFLGFYGPAAKSFSKKLIELKTGEPESEIPRGTIIKIKIAYWAIICLFYPILYILYFIDQVRQTPLSERNEPILDPRFLYFSQMSGSGNLECKDCGYQERVLGLWHGHGDERWSVSSYQCQTCGKFHQIKNNGDGTITKIDACDCGGSIQNKLPVFCRVCKEKNVIYHLRFMT